MMAPGGRITGTSLPEPPPPRLVPNCSEGGGWVSWVGIIGRQALEVIMVTTG
ncbi:MAG: hypothetical protein R2787_12880 [Saprospiraceae bacterium]